MTERGDLRSIGHPHDHPCWAPLEEAVGSHLACWFMWMNEELLEDGSAVHAYKHRVTRRYLHLASGPAAYGYLGGLDDARYRREPLQAAIAAVFVTWELLEGGPSPEDRDRVRVATEVAHEVEGQPARLHPNDADARAAWMARR